MTSPIESAADAARSRVSAMSEQERAALGARSLRLVEVPTSLCAGCARAAATEMKPEHLRILRHALGLDDAGHGRQYRNHYCAGGEDVLACDELVQSGHMVRTMPRQMELAVFGGSAYYTVTELGKSAAAPTARPEKPSRYAAWLQLADAFPPDWKFGDWLRAGCPGDVCRDASGKMWRVPS